MKKNELTLRRLISLVKSTPGWEEKMFQHIFKRDQTTYEYEFDKTFTDVEKVRGAYSHVMNELLDKVKSKPSKYPIYVKTSIDPFDKRKFTDVCLVNPNYVAPAKGLKPWGGKPPAGHYNTNLNKHNQWFAFGWTTWSKIIDAEVIIKTDKPLPLWEVLSYILWELTFDGWTEKQTEQNHKVLEKQLEKSVKQIKSGKFTKILKKNDELFDIVIPNCVTRRIETIIKKYENKSKKSKM